MFIPMRKLKHEFGVQSRHVLHLGAHLAEEAPEYSAAGVETVLWVEANPHLAEALHQKIAPYAGHSFLVAAVSDTSGEQVSFHITNNGQSSSLLKMKTHLLRYPNIRETQTITVTTITVDELMNARPGPPFDFLNMDLQGGELKALRGMTRTLESVRYVYTEINFEELYESCPLVEELDAYLGAVRFRRIVTARTDAGWGDALYVRPV